jgi:hypothetical protein
MRLSWQRRHLVGAAVGLLVVLGGWPAPATRAQQPASQLQELAERLLAAPYPIPDRQQEATVQLLPGQVPTDLPFVFQLPPAAQVVGSMVRSGGPLSGTTVVLDIPGAPDDVLTFYARELEAQHWRPASIGPFPSSGGFQTNPPGMGPVYCQSPNGPSLSLTIHPRTAGPNDVRLSTSTSPGLCNPPSPPGGTPQMPLGATLLPRLTPPPGVDLRGGSGGGGGPNRWSSEATAETTRSPAELEAHFAQQLAAAGWIRQDGRADGRLAWSAWTVPAEGDWRGLLVVAEWPEADRRLLTARVESPTLPPYGDSGIVTMGGGTYYTVPAVPVGPPPTALPMPPPPEPRPVAPIGPPPTRRVPALPIPAPGPPVTWQLPTTPPAPLPAPDMTSRLTPAIVPSPPDGGFVPSASPTPAAP